MFSQNVTDEFLKKFINKQFHKNFVNIFLEPYSLEKIQKLKNKKF
jgi:hypothetical protein